jgi:hypothetical protein
VQAPDSTGAFGEAVANVGLHRHLDRLAFGGVKQTFDVALRAEEKSLAGSGRGSVDGAWGPLWCEESDEECCERRNERSRHGDGADLQELGVRAWMPPPSDKKSSA